MNAFDHPLMATRHLRAIAMVLLIAVGATTAHADSVYKCRDARGQVAYQDHVCADPTRQTLVEIAPAPTPSPAPDVARNASPRAAQHNTVRTSRQHVKIRASETLSYECRAADGEVFYKHSGCPKTIAVAPANERRSSGRKSTTRGGATHPTTVSTRPLPRAEACKRMASGGSIGRPGREHDDAVSTYDRNAGRDPCRHS
ncbi:MAG: DUF4124 domain-containing protein [Dokdonella sp.]